MGWKEAQNRYKKSVTEQKVEDLVARRILKGLGLSSRNLNTLERLEFGKADFDTALWVRVLNVLNLIWRRNSLRDLAQRRKEAYWTLPNHKPIIDRVAEKIDDANKAPFIFGRVRGTKIAWAYSIWPLDKLGETLIPPFTALQRIDTEDGPAVIVVQDAVHFSEQFGPYALEISDES